VLQYTTTVWTREETNPCTETLDQTQLTSVLQPATTVWTKEETNPYTGMQDNNLD